ncbi:MAG: transcriptional repressor [Coriobacteriales bacterium]|jgi:Fur family peroxide stress response transcriptional regulator|nr:transcriptional repressor [Coriobacteriales bacterium]
MAAKRKSVQKQMIGEVLEQMNHPTAAEVYEQVRRHCPQISLGTVYRNLGSMAHAGEVLRLSFKGEPDRFDPQAQEHFHVVCTSCGRIFDADYSCAPELIQQLDRAMERCTGVAVEDRMLLFAGRCASCRGTSPTTSARQQDYRKKDMQPATNPQPASSVQPAAESRHVQADACRQPA